MFVESSTLNENSSESVALLTRGTIILVSRGDFFSDCLTGALLARFPQCSIKTIVGVSELQNRSSEKARLVLFYQVTKEELQEGLKILRDQSLMPSVGFVVDTVDRLDLSYVRQLIDLKMIDGVLPLTLGLDVFMAAVELVIKGGEHFPSVLLSGLHAKRSDVAVYARQPSESMPASRSHTSDHVSLTIREVQVLELIRRGMRNKNIAERLALSENTVKVHVRNIYKKMKVQNRIQAASFFDGRDDDFKSFS